ncbi:MAG: VWA domain-containing protein [Candidatus Woesearchaeota archaeon]
MKRYLMKRYLIFLLLLLFLNFPKTQFSIEDDIRECGCIGFSSQRSLDHEVCFGLPFNCEHKSVEEVVDEHRHSCEVSSCEIAREYLGFDSEFVDSVRSSQQERDPIYLLFVIDVSDSMKGSKINETVTAVRRLIDLLDEKDRAAIVSFNTKANIIQDFTSDKEVLYDSMDRIRTGETTFYVPALMKAYSLFEDIDENKQLIFLSDGKPGEEDSTILNYTKPLKERGVSVSSVWFGESEAESSGILEEMASVSMDGPMLGKKGFYESENSEGLFDSFQEIYESSHQRDNFFMIQSMFRDTYYEDSDIFVDLDVLSRRNNHVVPGYTIRDSQAFCADGVNLSVHFYSDKEHVLPLSFTSSYTGTIRLPPGEYSVFANVSVKYGNESDCVYDDFVYLKTIDVNGSRKTCEFNHSAMNETINSGSYFDSHFRNSRKLMLALDTSDSMGSRKISEIKEALPYFFDLFTREYDISFVTFSDEVSVLSSFLSDANVLKRRIEQVRVGGPTYYGPVFDLIQSYNESFPVIFISDGKSWDTPDFSLDNFYGIQVGSGSSPMDAMRTQSVFSDEYREAFINLFRDIQGYEFPLYLDLALNEQSFSAGDSLHLTAYVSSLYNGIHFPNEEPCLPEADVEVLVDGVNHDAALAPDGSYTLTIRDLEPGIHEINVSASVNGLQGERVFEVQVDGNEKDSFPLWGIILNISLIGILLWIERNRVLL